MSREDRIEEANQATTAAATRWMLDDDPPKPQTEPAHNAPKKTREAIEQGTMQPSDTHTGTDPLGRAIGPAEDPTEIKKVRDENGKIVTPKAPARPRKRT